MSGFPEIIVGTYEEFLLGFNISKDDEGKYKLLLDMASHAHQGSIRCVATSKELLVSSGADEYVNVFNINSRQEVAVLTPHAGTVTSLVFAPDGTHLISGSQDGSLVILRCCDWNIMKVWNGAHKKANGVIGLSIHPSGKLLLSIGADHILRAWNLVKGRQAYAVNFGKRITPGNTLNCVTWSVDGEFYAITIGQTIEVYNTASAAITYAVQCATRVSCFDLSQKSIVAIGRDDGMIEIHDFVAKQPVLEQKAHEQRIKCLQFFTIGDEELFLVTADSGGIIKLWRWRRHRKIQKLIMEATIDADCRILCLTLASSQESKNVSNENEGPLKVNTNKNTKVGKGQEMKEKKVVQLSNDSDAESTSTNNVPTLKENENITEPMIEMKLKKQRISIEAASDNNKSSDSPTSQKKRKSSNFEVTMSPKSLKVKRANASTSQWNVS